MAESNTTTLSMPPSKAAVRTANVGYATSVLAAILVVVVGLWGWRPVVEVLTLSMADTADAGTWESGVNASVWALIPVGIFLFIQGVLVLAIRPGQFIHRTWDMVTSLCPLAAVGGIYLLTYFGNINLTHGPAESLFLKAMAFAVVYDTLINNTVSQRLAGRTFDIH